MDHLNAFSVSSGVLNRPSGTHDRCIQTSYAPAWICKQSNLHLPCSIGLFCTGCANADAGVQQLLLVLTMKLDPSDDRCTNISGNDKPSCLKAARLPTWDQHNAGWLTSWVLLISSSSLAI